MTQYFVYVKGYKCAASVHGVLQLALLIDPPEINSVIDSSFHDLQSISSQAHVPAHLTTHKEKIRQSGGKIICTFMALL